MAKCKCDPYFLQYGYHSNLDCKLANMKVYAVLQIERDECRVLSVFKTFYKAEQYCVLHGYKIQHYIDSNKIEFAQKQYPYNILRIEEKDLV